MAPTFFHMGEAARINSYVGLQFFLNIAQYDRENSFAFHLEFGYFSVDHSMLQAYL